MRTFEELVVEGESIPTDGWDFSWFDKGRGTEERPVWKEGVGYQDQLCKRLSKACAVLDLYTGGGEVLAGAIAGAEILPSTMAAIEYWPPNINEATQRLHPLGVTVVVAGENPPLPFGDEAFDLVTARHPSTMWWDEFARVLKPGGTYFAQHVGGDIYNNSLKEYFLGPQPESPSLIRGQVNPNTLQDEVAGSGLEITDLQYARIKMKFYDVAAVIHYLRKLPWIVPDFNVEEYRDKLFAMHEKIQDEGSFASENSRILIEARKQD